MIKLKGFIKWTDIALSLKEIFDEIKGVLKDHEKEFKNLQSQNMLLLQQIDFQNKTIDEIKSRLNRLEDRQEVYIKNPAVEDSKRKELPREID